MVKTIRLQNPSPKARVTAAGDAPFSNAAAVTTTSAIAANTKASGNHVSAHSVNRNASRANTPSRAAASGAVLPGSVTRLSGPIVLLLLLHPAPAAQNGTLWPLLELLCAGARRPRAVNGLPRRIR